MRRPIRNVLSVAVALAITASGASTALAFHPDDSVTPLETANAAISRQSSLEGMVLLDNHNKVLPIAKSGNLALFGCGAMSTVRGGTGSGSMNNRPTGNISARKGFEDAGYTITTNDTYWAALDAVNGNVDPANPTCQSTENLIAEWAPRKNFEYEENGSINAVYNYGNPIYPDVKLYSSTVKPKAPTDTALYIVGRNSGEHWDRYLEGGDYYLSDIELANIQLIGRSYKNVVVVLNIAGIIDTKFFDQINRTYSDPTGGDPLDALFILSQAGQEGGAALPVVLNGTETPSGKLTDTWAKYYEYYPAAATFGVNDYSDKTHFPATYPIAGATAENFKKEAYTEGVYVGYRYFDSFYSVIAKGSDKPADVVTYPFGFGLSYTDFSVKADSVTSDLKGNTVVKATVRNIGQQYSGKEVVQVYFSAPVTGLDKPYQELVGYGKTDVLAPSQEQQITITFPTTELGSYDESKSAYVMDAGDYVIRVGNSSRNTHVAGVLQLGSTTIVEQLSKQFRDVRPDNELTSDPNNFYSYPEEAAEIAAAARITLSADGFAAPNNASTLTQDVTIATSGTNADPLYATQGDRYTIAANDKPVNKISSVTSLLSPEKNANNWEGTGAPYSVNTSRGETVKTVAPLPASVTGSRPTLYDVYDGKITMEQFVASLSVDEMAHLVVGRSSNATLLAQVPSARGSAGFTTEEHADLGIPTMSLPDGPAGLRITREYPTSSPTEFQFATAFPVAMMLAQSFNPQLMYEVGNAVGSEMDEYGATLWLAPALNLHRDPLCGRNFEYYSEDPLLSGLSASYITQGVQSHAGRGVTLKHFAANNQEAFRSAVDESISERTLREIYLKGFEIAVKSSQPMAIMSSYNKVNGVLTFQDYDLLINALRGEWDFHGLVMTDWSSVIRGNGMFLATQYAGNDLIMPGSNRYSDITTLVKPVDPDFDKFGLPAVGEVIADTGVGLVDGKTSGEPVRYETLRKGFLPLISPTPVNPSQGYKWYSYDPSSNFRVSATGSKSLVKVVNSIPSGNATSVIYNSLPAANTATRPNITTVQEAYEFVQLITGPVDPGDKWTSVLTAAEKAAVSVSNVVNDPGTGDVTSYTVTLKGDYQTDSLRLGELQRNATNILNVTIASQPFQYLANHTNGRPDITVTPFADKYELTTYNASTPGAKVDTVPAPATPGDITGTAAVGSALIAPSVGWPAGTTLSYQWLRNGAPIAGATSATYTLDAADLGASIGVAITGAQAGKGSSTVVVKLATVVAPKLDDGSIEDKPAVPAITKIKVAQTTLQLVKGKSLTIPAVAYTAAGKSAEKLTWTSSNKKIATVTAAGKIKATKKTGKATITVKSANGKKATIKVTVVKKATKIKSVKAKGISKTLAVGKTAAAVPSYSPAKATGVKVTYKSSKPKVASVDKAGTVTAKAKGKATITVKAGSKSKKYTVTVK